MFALHGVGVGQGIAIGKAYCLDNDIISPANNQIAEEEIANELARLVTAKNEARKVLQQSLQTIGQENKSELSTFISMHLTMLEDVSLLQQATNAIEQDLLNAEAAISAQQQYWVEQFAQIDDDYLRDKSQDIKQILQLVQTQLINESYYQLPRKIMNNECGDIILVAKDISPSAALKLREASFKAFITCIGGPISHTAILARSMSLPAIVGMSEASTAISTGDLLIVDGKRGVAIVNPDPALVAAYERRRLKIERREQDIAKCRHLKAETLNNEAVTLSANLELVEDVQTVIDSQAESIGLLRTEFLYLENQSWPDEQTQFDYYQKIAMKTNLPLTIRTFDIGADKSLGDGSDHAFADNPALGLRAVRLGLRYVEQMKIQLRAILRLSAEAKVRILLPMISNTREVVQVRRMLDEIKADFTDSQIPFDDSIELGVMVETPAAALNVDLLAEHSDFFSIGTNDLIQYTLAIDRTNDDVNYLYEPLHPAILRLLKNIIETANKYNKKVAMCGEMAADPRYTRLLLWMGLREFSMEPNDLLKVKEIVRMTDVARLEQALSPLSSLSSAMEIEQALDKINSIN